MGSTAFIERLVGRLRYEANDVEDAAAAIDDDDDDDGWIDEKKRPFKQLQWNVVRPEWADKNILSLFGCNYPSIHLSIYFICLSGISMLSRMVPIKLEFWNACAPSSTTT